MRLDVNCRSSWPAWTCAAGNASGYLSSALWFVVLVPQLIKNHRRRSTHGLSLVWAMCNFTASLFNVFFVYRSGLPLFSRVSAAYMPVLEAAVLVQFVAYDAARCRARRVLLATAFASAWAAAIAAEVLEQRVTGVLAWVAVGLWSVETLPQIVLNWRLDSAAAQSRASVAIAVVGKTADFAAAYLLDMPLQVALLAFFSSASAYVNTAQVMHLAAASKADVVDDQAADPLLADPSGSPRPPSSFTSDLLHAGAAACALGAVGMAGCLALRAATIRPLSLGLTVAVSCPAALSAALAAGYVWARRARRQLAECG